eukprot:11101935-Lingulodinium_polyedra.AAC.1
MSGKSVLFAALSADWSAEMTDFLRKFDVHDHDPATTSASVDAFCKRLRALFCDGRVLAQGADDTLASIAVNQLAEPLTLHYGDRVKVLSMDGSTRDCKEALSRLQLATDLALDRIKAELNESSLSMCFEAFNLATWYKVKRSPSDEGQTHADGDDHARRASSV